MNTTVVTPATPARQNMAWKLATTPAPEAKETKKIYEGFHSQVVCIENRMSCDDKFEGIIGRSAPISTLREQIKVVAPTNSTVLVLGETGTGKELIARAIHNLSSRRDRLFIKINCAAIPAGLIESELFGHERGGFTGAVGRRTGRFEMAHGGTLFLDEIGDIPLELQSKLLREIQEQEFERVGDSQTMQVDVRIVAATSRDLLRMVAVGQFRADLYYRLNIFPLCVPALRERSADIPLLVQHFMALHAKNMNKSVKEISFETMLVLTRYTRPGSVIRMIRSVCGFYIEAAQFCPTVRSANRRSRPGRF